LLVRAVDVDVFPLAKIYYLWDHFLTGPAYLYLFVAVSVLQQLRDQLLASDFTNAMLVFSELSEVSLETCIIDSIRNFQITPPSIIDELRHFIAEPQELDLNQARFSFHSSRSSIVALVSMYDFLAIQKYAVIVDTRSLEIFKRGHYPGSICVIESSFSSPESLSFGMKILLQRSQYIVVITDQETSPFANYLLQQGQVHVCLFPPDNLFSDCVPELCSCQPGFFGNAWQYKCVCK
jgi:TBC domain-containing protein kinase-like protein